MEELKMQIEALQKALAAVTARVEELANATPAVKADVVEALSAQVKGLEGKIVVFSADLAAENGKRDKAALLESAARDGKVVALTAEAVSKLSVSDLQAHVATLTPSIPLNRRTPASAATLDGHGISLIEQYNAIQDPLKRIEFFRANRSKISAL